MVRIKERDLRNKKTLNNYKTINNNNNRREKLKKTKYTSSKRKTMKNLNKS